MAKSKSQRMKEYRARKKAALGDAWLRKENQRVKTYYVPVSELREDNQSIRRSKNNVWAAKYRHKCKLRRLNQNESNNVTDNTDGIDNTPRTNDEGHNGERLTIKMSFARSRSSSQESGRQSRGRTRVSRALAKQYRRNETLADKNESLQRKLKSAQKKIERFEKKLKMQSQCNTPRSKTDNLLRREGIDPKDAPKVRRKVLYAECLSEEIKEASSSNDCQKQCVVRRIVTGQIVKRYRLKSAVGHNTNLNRKKMGSYSKSVQLKKQSRLQSINLMISREIREFLAREDNSRLLPGKADAIKVGPGQTKEQKRVLNDYMYNLHAKFNAEATCKVSLATFCRRRPPAYSLVNFASRNVCLCSKHQNFALKLRCLKNLKVTSISSPDKFMETYQRDEVKDMMDTIALQTVIYQEWKRKKMKDGKERMRIVDIELPKEEFVDMMMQAYLDFAAHIHRVLEQYKSIRSMKERLPKGHALIQMDFSENYLCQNLDEIQSAYWNATAVTLHPTVIYHKDENGKLVHKSIVFVSEVLQHNAAMVLAVIKKSLKSARDLVNDLKCIHFWTDSPTSQYRNKSVFDVVSHFAEDNGVNATWHYFEVGHGKGPCDGIGGTTKRNADNAIKQGKVVIQDADDFFRWASKYESQIDYQMITEDEFNTSKTDIENRNKSIKPIKGTMKFHSVLGMGNGRIRSRETTCACENCFTADGFNDQTTCHWDDHSLSLAEIGLPGPVTQTESITEGETVCQLNQGDFVVIAYDKECYIGQIEEIDKDDGEVEVSCMERCGKVGGRFRWPKKEDKIWVNYVNVLKTIDEPIPTGKSRRVFTTSEEVDVFMKSVQIA